LVGFGWLRLGYEDYKMLSPNAIPLLQNSLVLFLVVWLLGQHFSQINRIVHQRSWDQTSTENCVSVKKLLLNKITEI
jgi:hypothetical protein